MLKHAVVHSVSYADTAAHIAVVYEFIWNHKFDYCFSKYWERKPPEGIMQPFVQSDGRSDLAIEKLCVNSAKKLHRAKSGRHHYTKLRLLPHPSRF